MKRIELLAPAGNLEKLKTAFYFGADACYFAGKKYGLRAFAGNFEEDNLKESIAYAHSLGKKAYITVNIIAKNVDFNGLKEYILYLQEIGANAVICADVGVISIVREVAPSLAIHVSTQANITNKYAAKMFVDMGASRLVLARELSLTEIKEIRDFIPEHVEIETFVHGAMCIAYSGRCLLSNYLTNRDANRGACAQSCRWEYSITEKSRRGQHLDVQEDERGTYILNSKDLCMIEHLHQLVEAGVTSFKIEGRMKSAYYVANIVNVYRRAIDYLESLDNPNDYKLPSELVGEVAKSSHRHYSTGFYFDNAGEQNLETSMPIQTSEFVAVVLEKLDENKYLIEQRNKFEASSELEILSPGMDFNKRFVATSLTDVDGNDVVVANQVQQQLVLIADVDMSAGDILRMDV